MSVRVMLVTWTKDLAEKLSNLNHEIEYCAIVTDDVEDAKKVAERVGLSKNLIYPFYDLKECIKNFYYDYIICADNPIEFDLTDMVKSYDAPKNKVLNIILIPEHFVIEAWLRWWKERSAEIEMFATGISYIAEALSPSCFKYKLFNFAFGSQDLYYDFQIAKHIVTDEQRNNKLSYALIGLAPYSFHYDLSKASSHFRILKYFIAFGDVHNFFIPAEVYRQIFCEEYLNRRLPIEIFDNKDSSVGKASPVFMTPKTRLGARKEVDNWDLKYYPETRDENIKIFDDYLTLCEKNNICPIIFLPPMTEAYIKHFNRAKLDDFYYIIRQACKKHPSAFFVDGWKIQGFSDADFRDASHLNSQGATKFSLILNEIIELIEKRGGEIKSNTDF